MTCKHTKENPGRFCDGQKHYEFGDRTYCEYKKYALAAQRRFEDKRRAEMIQYSFSTGVGYTQDDGIALNSYVHKPQGPLWKRLWTRLKYLVRRPRLSKEAINKIIDV